MSFLHAFLALAPVLAVFAAICLAAWAACRERHVPGPLLLCGPLPTPDATDAEFELWALQALAVANARPNADDLAAIERTASEIRRLPEVTAS